MIRILFFLLLAMPSILSAQLTPHPAGTLSPVGFYQFLPDGYNPTGSYKYPLVIQMPGAGERGDGSAEQLDLTVKWSLGEMIRGGATLKFNFGGQPQAFVVLFPQLPETLNNWEPSYINAMIDYAAANLNIDINKVFLTGYSLGGGGSWIYPSSSLANANRIAGIIPVSASPLPTDKGYDLCNIAQGKVAVWAHHGIDDDVIDVKYTTDAIAGIKACMPTPVIPPIATIYPDGMHNLIWLRALDTMNIYQHPNMWEWMAGTSRLNTPENNQAPIAAAGTDITLMSPSNSTILNGSTSSDPNDVIVKYAWTKIAGPANYTIEKPGFPATNLSNLGTGNYTFRLTVTDEFGVTRTDDVNVNVLGALPIGISYFKGTNSGKINNLSWATSSEENADHFEITRSTDGNNFSVIGILSAGKKTYSFSDDNAPAGISYYRLKNIDKDGAFSYSDIITIKNNSPVVALSTYPNPVKDRLTLKVQGAVYGNIEVSIHNIDGKLVRKQTIAKQDFSWSGTLSLGNLQKGVYTIQVQKGGSLKEAGSFVKE